MASMWAVPVLIKLSFISLGISPCSPIIRALIMEGLSRPTLSIKPMILSLICSIVPLKAHFCSLWSVAIHLSFSI